MNSKKIISFLNSKFPVENIEPWDKSGQDFGDFKKEVSSIGIALDLNSYSLDKALEYNVDMMIVHHPFFWAESREEEYEMHPYKKVVYDKTLWKGISCFSIHTNYDNSPEGMWLQVANHLGFKNAVCENKYGARINKKITGKEMLDKIKKINIKVKDKNITPKQQFDSIVIYPGSGDIKSIVESSKTENTLVISSDAKWSDWMTIEEANVSFIEVEHAIENVFVNHLGSLLKAQFPNMHVKKINIR